MKTEPEVDEEFLARACWLAADKILTERLARMKRARRLMKRAYDAVMASKHEVELATDLCVDAARDWAKAKTRKGETT